MSRYILKNISESTLEIIIPGYISCTGHTIQVLIPRSNAIDAGTVMTDPSTYESLPRIRSLIHRNLLEVHIS